ncbi:MAG TPA: ERCC4 domain-containing protein [Solirubrobacteraceae bacterium]|jgi:hypothetical protein|nr:ERCC4 domain-containing protein [Solirubrobacteraceae bacterium]
MLGSLEEVSAAAILYDHREERCGIPRALRAAGITATGAQLPAGDYVLSDRVVVERKTSADLAASIKDRRLFEQVDRLAEAYDAVVVIIEGDPIHIAGKLEGRACAGPAQRRRSDSNHGRRRYSGVADAPLSACRHEPPAMPAAARVCVARRVIARVSRRIC